MGKLILTTDILYAKTVAHMKLYNNLEEDKTLLKFQNKWIAFDKGRNVIGSNTSYLGLLKALSEDQKQNAEITFLYPASDYLAP